MKKTICKQNLAQLKALNGERFLDDEGFIIHPTIVQVYLQAGRYSHPCRISGIYAELYITDYCRSVYIESEIPYRADFKIGTLDEHGYFHYTADENLQEVKAA